MAALKSIIWGDGETVSLVDHLLGKSEALSWRFLQELAGLRLYLK